MIDELVSRYAGTKAAFLGAEAVYTIPVDALATLGTSPLWARDRLHAERAFTDHCRRNNAVGVRGRGFVLYGWLTAPLAVDPAVAAACGWTAANLAAVAEAAGRTAAARDRLLGVAGRLVTAPQFIAETAALRASYEQLEAGDRPTWPLRRPVRRQAPTPGDREATAALSGFLDRLTVYLDRWGLTGLADWDLPDPQGPLLPSPLPPGAPAEPAHGVRVIVPVHYPLQGDDDLLRQVRRAQEQAARALGLPAAIASVANHQQFAQLFRLVRLESALRSRWPARPPRGAVGLIEGAAAAELGVAAESVRRMRKWVAALRAGRPASLSGRGAPPARA